VAPSQVRDNVLLHHKVSREPIKAFHEDRVNPVELLYHFEPRRPLIPFRLARYGSFFKPFHDPIVVSLCPGCNSRALSRESVAVYLVFARYPKVSKRFCHVMIFAYLADSVKPNL
jgi:hypothetical protein